MSCHNNCGCSPSGYPSANNECCTDVAQYTRFAYSSAQSAYANAQNAEQSAEDAVTTLSSSVLKAGSTMTGLLVLSGDPVASLGAATKQYADTKVNKAGDTMTGLLTLSGNPVNNLQAATKQYVDAADALKLNTTGGAISGSLSVSTGISSAGSITSTSPSALFGYSTGSGSTVTQTVSRTNGVTINANCGTIQLFSAAGSATYASFTVTNSSVTSTDTIILNQQFGTDLYETHVTNVTSGSFRITFRTTGGTTTEQPIFSFSILHAVNS